MTPQLGAFAPDFSLPSTIGDLSLSSFRGQHVVLVFYPLDFSPVCSAQIPEYSAQLDDFADLGAAVLGISRDSLYTHRAWAREYGIEAPLLADMKLEVARLYGVEDAERGVCKRAVFLVDKAGKLRFEHVEAQGYTLRPNDVLSVLSSL